MVDVSMAMSRTLVPQNHRDGRASPVQAQGNSHTVGMLTVWAENTNHRFLR